MCADYSFLFSGDWFFSFLGLVRYRSIRGARCACSLAGWKHSAFVLPDNYDSDHFILFHTLSPLPQIGSSLFFENRHWSFLALCQGGAVNCKRQRTDGLAQVGWIVLLFYLVFGAVALSICVVVCG